MPENKSIENEKSTYNKKKEESGKKSEPKEPILSDEDKQLIEELNMLVERLMEPNESLYKPALIALQNSIRTATTSMTSVPKPLKFLRTHFDNLKLVYEKINDIEIKHLCGDVLSILGMTSSTTRECLKYKLLSPSKDIGSWGFEYVRHLSGEVINEWNELENTELSSAKKDSLLTLINQVTPYLMRHNAEPEACDILMEVEMLEKVVDLVDENVYKRVALYLKNCVPYVAEPENTNLLKTIVSIYRKFNQHSDALLTTIQLGDVNLIKTVYTACSDPTKRKQLACILGKSQLLVEFEEEGMSEEDNANLVLEMELQRNAQLNAQFLNLARELDIMEPKIPEDIYKSHLEPSRTSLANIDSARQNLAASFVNGFVNAAFGKDKLLAEDANAWFYKNKDHGMMSAAASLGLILLWDIDGGLAQLDKYLYSKDDPIKAGCLLGCGIINVGVRNECDPALALLSDYVMHNTDIMRIGAILGLGLAYAGSDREDVIEILLPVFSDPKANAEVIGVTSVACGMICVGSCNGNLNTVLLQVLMEKSDAELKNTFSRFIALGLGLIFLGKQDGCDPTLAALEVMTEPYRSMATTLVDVCAYAGTGNVLKVQALLHACSEHYDIRDQDNNEKKEDKNKKKDAKVVKDKDTEMNLSSSQAVGVLGIALIGMGEDIGSEMSFRTFGHLLRYGEPAIKRAVPLALALTNISNPKLQVLDVLSKFSHDTDSEVAHNAILAMGLVGAGTNNARLATMLRQLAVYHAKDANNLFCIRIAQGLTHLGKGTLTLCPFHYDKQIMNPISIAGLLAFLVSCLDVKNILLNKSHYLIYTLVAAMKPRMLVTFDKDFNPLPVTVRVGQAVDVVCQAGNPKTITGFQTHTTPVLLAYGERAELATDEYLSLTPVMEGFVILEKNLNYSI